MNVKYCVQKIAILGMVAAFSGCAMNDGDLQYDEAISSLSFTGWFVYDGGTTCTVDGGTLHCCPPGFAMIGVNLDSNSFKCAELTEVIGGPHLDTPGNETVRNSMHACPSNTVMVGFHEGNNWLACVQPFPGVSFEFVDGNPATVNPDPNHPMHICPSNYAMAGIHVDNNLFTCDL